MPPDERRGVDASRGGRDPAFVKYTHDIDFQSFLDGIGTLCHFTLNQILLLSDLGEALDFRLGQIFAVVQYLISAPSQPTHDSLDLVEWHRLAAETHSGEGVWLDEVVSWQVVVGLFLHAPELHPFAHVGHFDVVGKLLVCPLHDYVPGLLVAFHALKEVRQGHH